MSGDPYFSNVTSLLHFDGANGSTTFTDAKGLSYTSAGGAALSTTGPKFGTASLALNGTTQYLEAADNAAFKVGGGSFTIEAWVYLAADPAAGAFAPIASHGNSTADGSYFFAIASGRQLHFSFNSAGTTVAGGTVALNTWTHVAVVQNGSTLALFINGSSVASGGVPLAGSIAGAFRIGRGRATSSNYFNGRIDEFRITKGVDRYAANFTPSAAAFLDTDGVVSLLHFDGANGSTTFTDVKGKVWTSAGLATISTVQSKFGGASAVFTNTAANANGRISSPHNADFDLSAADFTVEAWVYNTATAGNQVMVGKDGVFGVSYPSWSIIINGSRKFSLQVGSGNGTSSLQAMPSTASVALNTWTHVAAVRSGSTVRLFIDGVLDSTHTITATITDGAKEAYIGDYTGNTATADGKFQGYLDDVRITKGVARYTANFTPPAAAFPDTDNVVSLMHFDGADGSTTFTDVKGKAWTAFGNAQIDNAQSKFGGVSGYFDGAGDYISTPSSADFAYGTGDFTWEAWVCLATTAGNQYIIEHGTNGGSLTYNGGLKYYNTTIGISSALYTTGGGALLANVWYHIAVSRNSGITRFFVNGALMSSAADTHNYAAQTLQLGVYGGGGLNLNGWIDEFRITKGVAHYTANFTVPTEAFEDASSAVQPTTGYGKEVLIDSPIAYYRLSETSGLVAFDYSGYGRDGSYSATGVTPGVPGLLATDTDAAAYFDPATDTSQVNCNFNAELYWGCTLEAIVNIDAVQPDDQATIITKRRYFASANTDFPISLVYQKSDGKLYLNLDSGGNFTADLQLSAAITTGVPHHVVGVYRPNNVCELWIDGVKVAFGNFTGTISGSNLNWLIGASHGFSSGIGQHRFKGVIDEAAIYSHALSASRIQKHFSVFKYGIDQYWSNVVALLRMDGNSGSTAFPDETGGTWIASGTAQVGVAQSKFGGASALFDANASTFVYQTTNTKYNLGTSDFAIEAWVYAQTLDGSRTTAPHPIISRRTGSTNGWVFTVYGDGSIGLRANIGGTWGDFWGQSPAGGVAAATWCHVAVAREGSTFRFFVNGALVSSFTNASAIQDQAEPVRIGVATAAGEFAGVKYIDELRITKGVARYTGSFTVPASPFPTDEGTPVGSVPETGDPSYNNVSSLLHMDGTNGSTTFTDQRGHTWTAAGNAQISTTRSKFGGASAYFDGTLDEIYTGNNDIAAATTVTLEAWVYLPTSGGGGAIFGQGKNQGASDQFLNITANRAVEFYKGVNVSGTLLQLFTPNGVVPLDTWTHIALVLTGSQVRIYVAGVLQASASSATAFWANTGFAFRIGRHVVQNYESFQFYFTGYIDEVRITKGVERYTANFTPPAEAFPDSQGSGGGTATPTPVTRSFGFVA